MLENNPIFMQVTHNLARIKAGQGGVSVDSIAKRHLQDPALHTVMCDAVNELDAIDCDSYNDLESDAQFMLDFSELTDAQWRNRFQYPTPIQNLAPPQ
jgi:hypothetical protein